MKTKNNNSRLLSPRMLWSNISVRCAHFFYSYSGLRTNYNAKAGRLGFTLIELLVAIAIIGIISIVAVQTLYDSVTIRARQNFIEDSSDDFRILASNITKNVMEAQRVSVPNPSEIRITGDGYCQTIIYDDANNTIVSSQVTSDPCTPPDSNFVTITDSNLIVTRLRFHPTGNSLKTVSMEFEGNYKNSLSDHPFQYKTSVTTRN